MIRNPWLFSFGAPALLALFFALPAQAAFTVNADGTVSDTVTGLTWDRCSYGQNNDAGCTGTATTHAWAQALGVAVTANAANYKGHNDWRLPNKNELVSLIDFSSFGPATDISTFSNTGTSWSYWSSTNYALDPANAWRIYFGDGSTIVNGKSDTFYVRLVRSGQFFDSFDGQGDVIPDAFGFAAQTGVAPGSPAISNTVTVAGLTGPTSIGIAGGAYSINGGAYTIAAGAIGNGDTVTLQLTASASYGATNIATLTIGGVSGTFSVTTRASSAASQIVIDPTAPARLYAGFDGGGVFWSSNSGGAWTAATTQPANPRVKALAIKPGDGTKLFAATYGGGVFKSTDSGVDWNVCAAQPANLNLLSLAMDAAGKLYTGSEAGIFVSTDGCDSWMAMNNGLP